MADDDLVEHIAIDESVIEVVTRREIRERRLRHRCTYIVVVDSADRVVVHQRARWKDVYPGWWDVAFGGVCDVGESWEAAAKRELFEEAGLRVPLQDLGSLHYDEADGLAIGRIFLARTDDEPVLNDGEVVQVDRIPRRALPAWAADRDVCLDSGQTILPMLTELD